MSPRRAPRKKLWHGCCMPFLVWDEQGEPLEPEDLPVSPELQAALRDWKDFIEQHVRWVESSDEDSWDDPAHRAEHERRGRGLHTWLQRELGEPVDLDLSAARVGW